MSRATDDNLKISGWDWLTNGLELTRIRATLSQFPVHDRIRADPIRDVEVWLKNSSDVNPTQEVARGDNKDMSSSDSSNYDSDVSMLDTFDDGAGAGAKSGKHVIDVDSWTGLGDDIRYSPAFILPLILGALENSLSKTGSSISTPEHFTSMSHEPNDECNGEPTESPAFKEFVLLAQRLCEKGALSLALGSLCSECPSLRKVAVATLGHIKRVLDTKEARKLNTWRERPQLAMIVDSVQRGLAVRIAMRLDPNESAPRLIVPKLPALSAVFLARAALIIMKPGDPMFSQMNRYFLRLDNGHGSFQDTNRLPAFISLFCSSSDEPGQARRERLWALQLLKDSFVEEYCYRMVDSCHAPELLMTSFESINARQGDDQHDTERMLLIDTIATLLSHGGRRAASHLIGRLGLLSWLRGQLVAGNLIHILPSLESRISFLRLLYTAVNMACLHLTVESSDRHHLITESKTLFSSIVMLYDDSMSHGLMSEQKDATEWGLFSVLTCELLHALVKVTEDHGSSEDLGDVEKFGILLAPASRMLQTIPQHLKKMAVTSLCLAPLCRDSTTSENAVTFSNLALSFLATNELNAEASAAVLRRVTLLMSMLEKELNSDSEILDALLACRSQCLCACREAWFQCLEGVLGKTGSSSSETLRISRAIHDASSYRSV